MGWGDASIRKLRQGVKAGGTTTPAEPAKEQSMQQEDSTQRQIKFLRTLILILRIARPVPDVASSFKFRIGT